MGTGRPQWQRRLRRGARPARRLSMAAVRSAPRQAPDAAVPHCARAARLRCGPPRPARHRLPRTRRWRHGADRIAGRPSPRMQRQIAGRRGRLAFGCSSTDVSRPTADPVGRRDHVAGTTPGVPIRTGASFVGVGSLRHRVVLYPISPPEPSSGLATINWIAEITVDNSRAGAKGTGIAVRRSTTSCTTLPTGTMAGSTYRRC